jgi:MFS family permease
LLLALFYLPVTLSIYGLGLWLPTLIKQFGGSDLVTGFVSSVPYIFGIIGLLIIPRSSDRLNDRYGHLAVLYVLGAIGLFFSAWLSLPVLQWRRAWRRSHCFPARRCSGPCRGGFSPAPARRRGLP